MDTERFLFLLEEEVEHFSCRKTNLKSEGSNAVKFQFEARASMGIFLGIWVPENRKTYFPDFLHFF